MVKLWKSLFGGWNNEEGDARMELELKLVNAKVGHLDGVCFIESVAFDSDRFSRRQFRYLLERANAVFKVALSGELVIGYSILLTRRNWHHMRLYSLAVEPTFSGRGIGSRLLLDAENEAQANHARSLRLEVRKTNGRALSLYGKQGYLKVREISQYYENGDDAIVMEKFLKNQA